MKIYALIKILEVYIVFQVMQYSCDSVYRKNQFVFLKNVSRSAKKWSISSWPIKTSPILIDLETELQSNQDIEYQTKVNARVNIRIGSIVRQVG